MFKYAVSLIAIQLHSQINNSLLGCKTTYTNKLNTCQMYFLNNFQRLNGLLEPRNVFLLGVVIGISHNYNV